jgi:hypothetical protein
MNYYVLRNGQRFGPYTLADLQRYVGSGDILPTDLAQSEGMQDWVPVSQVIGNIAVVQAPQPQVQNYGQTPGYGQPGYGAPGYGAPGYGAQGYPAPGYSAPGYVAPGYVAPGYAAPGIPASAAQYPAPPDLHWALLLVLLYFCGFFVVVWMFIISGYVKKLDPTSKGTLFYALSMGCAVLTGVVFVMGMSMVDHGDPSGPLAFAGLLFLASMVLQYIGHFNVKGSLENHFNTAEPINLRLSGPMTFFFNIIYFQYHFNRINNWRRTGFLM